MSGATEQDCKNLYREIVLEHNRNPRNFGALADAQLVIDADNPLCGDHYKLYVDFNGDALNRLGFTGRGCAVSKASSSILTQLALGKSSSEFNEIYRDLVAVVSDEKRSRFEELNIFQGVAKFPTRAKCATLSWEALRRRLDGFAEPLSKETSKEVSQVEIYSQWTPNPNAYKFITSDFVIGSGKAGFTELEDCKEVPLVHTLLQLNGVTQVHLYENVITVTQDGSEDWGELTERIEVVIKKLLPDHDTGFNKMLVDDKSHLSPELKEIDDILERTIRPGLQADGGDVEVLSIEDNILSIRYEGACGTCPSSIGGTLQAITSFLRAEYHPEIEVVAV